MSLRSRLSIAVLSAGALHLAAMTAAAQLRIVTYNDSGSNSGAGSQLSTILKAIGDESHAGIAKPLDIISLQEQDLALLSTSRVVTLLNSLYGAGTYRASTITGGGDTTQAVVYNTKTVQLVDQKAFLSTSSSGAARQSLRFEFRPVGYTSTADFYLYSDHYKAGDATTDVSRRNVEAQGVRADAATLGAEARILYTGDFNVYNSNEAMYKTLLAAGNGQAIDPINRPGSWHNSSSFASIHTQSPSSSGGAYGGQTSGGMDDRFDFQLSTAPVQSGRGFSYIADTYHAFGNAGLQFNQDADAAGAAAALLPNFPGYTTAQVQSVLHALTVSGDHIPVVADYRVPAMMTATVNPLSPRVLVGANLSASVNVANSASALTPDSADRLDFVATGSGAVSGLIAGTDNALGGAAQVSLPLNTSSPGAKSGMVNISSSSPGVANGTFAAPVQYTVLAHSNASFDSVDDVNELDVHLIAAGNGTGSAQVSLFNLLSGLSPTAGLQWFSLIGAGDTSEISLTAPQAGILAAGDSTSLLIELQGLTAGTAEATYQFILGDETLPGSTLGTDLTLHVTAQVIPEPATFLSTGCIFAIAALRRRC